MLHGRGEELARLRSVASDARAFAGRALVVSGDPGMGKTALLDAASSEAVEEGSPGVARAWVAVRGVSFRSPHFSSMLLPIAGRVGELPPAQAAVLGGALGFSDAAPADPLAVAAAALNLLGIVSGERPILLVCDDTQCSTSRR